MTVAQHNDVTRAIARCNADTIRAMEAFRIRYEQGEASWADFSTLKHKHPYVGFVACEAQGIEFVIFHANDDQLAWEYQWFGPDAYERDLIAQWVDWCRTTPAPVVYDIGAYTGVLSVLAAKANPRATVHAFEPVARTIERAKINMRANGVARQVTLHNVAASNENGRAEINLYRSEDFLGSGSSIDEKALPICGVKAIDVVRVDDALGGGAPDLVKIDVEGHELAVLRGMAETIQGSRPMIIVEVWPDTSAEVLALLGSWGYRCERFEQEERKVLNYRCVPY